MHYDLIVCGAGPAGSIAAATAARAGLKVALIEKYPLPRHKTCGGGIPMVIESFLYDLSPTAFVETRINHIRHTWNFSDEFLTPINADVTGNPLSLWMLQRSIFDNELSQQAVRAGVDLQDNLAVTSVEIEKTVVRVHLRSFSNNLNNKEKMVFSATANWVIGADGASGETVKATNLRKNPKIALAMEAEIPYDWNIENPNLNPELVHLEYGATQNGYGWIFPKKDHLNIGSGLFYTKNYKTSDIKSVNQDLKKVILDYLNSLNIKYDANHIRFRAHPLPYWSRKEDLHTKDGMILLAGDAAGLINPLFFDGILHAAKSGVIAAECIINNDTQNYSRRIYNEISKDFNTAYKISRFFYKYPEFCYQNIVKRDMSTRTAVRLISGEILYGEIPGKMISQITKHLKNKYLGSVKRK